MKIFFWICQKSMTLLGEEVCYLTLCSGGCVYYGMACTVWRYMAIGPGYWESQHLPGEEASVPAGSHTSHQLPDNRTQNNIQGQSIQYVQAPALLATNEKPCHHHHHCQRRRYQGYSENDDCHSRGCGHIVDNAKSWRPLLAATKASSS